MSFECLEVAVQAAESLAPLIRRVAARSRSAADQLERATWSIGSNIDEGRGAIGKQQLHYYRVAYGSAREVGTQLRLAVAFGWLDDLGEAPALLDRVRAMLWRLTH
jgi:four helix bundle protein